MSFRSQLSGQALNPTDGDSTSVVVLTIVQPDGQSYEIQIPAGSHITDQQQHEVIVDMNGIHSTETTPSTSTLPNVIVSPPMAINKNPQGRNQSTSSTSSSYIDSLANNIQQKMSRTPSPNPSIASSADNSDDEESTYLKPKKSHRASKSLTLGSKPPRRKRTRKKSANNDDMSLEMSAFNNAQSEEDFAQSVGQALAAHSASLKKDDDFKVTAAETDGLVSDKHVADYIQIAMGAGTAPVKPLGNIDRALQWAEKSAFTRMVVKPFITFANYSANNWHWLLLGIITAIPGGINAFCNPIGLDPKNLIAALQTMSFETLMTCLWSMWSNLSLNSAMNTEFFRKLQEDFASVKKVWESGPVGKISIIAAFGTGVSAALAAGAIGYSAFLFLPAGEVTALIPAALNAIITFISRFNGLLKLITRVRAALTEHLDQDKKLRDNAVYQLDHLSDEAKIYLKEFMQNKQVNETSTQALFTEMERLTELQQLRPTILQWLKEKNTTLDIHFNLTQELSEHIDNLIDLKQIDDLQAFTKNKISANLIIKLAQLHTAMTSWIHAEGNKAQANKADGANEVNEMEKRDDVDDTFKTRLIAFLADFAGKNEIDLTTLLSGQSLSINNIDHLMNEINRYPHLKRILKAALISDAQQLSYIEILRIAKNTFMEQKSLELDIENLTDDSYATLNIELAQHLNVVAQENNIPINQLIHSPIIHSENVDALLKLMQLVTTDTKIINDPSFRERFSSFGKWTWLAGKLGCSAVAAYLIAEVFDYKGEQGVNLLIKQVLALLSKIPGFSQDAASFSLDNLSDLAKLAIGAAPAMATSLFYFIHVFDFLDSIMEKYLVHLKNHPEEIPLAAIILVHTYYSGGGMRNIAANIAKDKNNFVGLGSDPFSQIKVELNGALASLVNTKIIIGTLATSEAKPDLPYAHNTDGVAGYLENLNTVPKGLGEALRSNILFFKEKVMGAEQPSLRASSILIDGAGIV